MTGITNTLTYLLREDGLCERRLSQVVWMFATDDSPCASLACCRRWLSCPSTDFLTAIPRKLLPHLVSHAWAKAGDRLGIDERFEARGIENARKNETLSAVSGCGPCASTPVSLDLSSRDGDQSRCAI